MRQRWKILLGVCGVAALVIICFFCLRDSDKEPSYNGRTLSEWLDKYERLAGTYNHTNSEFQDVTAAINQLGTNHALLLAHWFVDGCATEKRVLRVGDKIPILRPWLAPIKTRAERDRIRGADGMRIIGTNGLEALPFLEKTFGTTSDSGVLYTCAASIRGLGSPGLAFLLSIVKQGGTNLQRGVAIQMLGQVGYLGTNATPAVGVLLNVAQDTNDLFHYVALSSAAELPLSNDRVIAVVTNRLLSTNAKERWSGVNAARMMKRRGEPIIPTLQRLAKDPDARFRDAVIDTIRLVHGDPSSHN